jgi:hypothetical protein
MSYTSVTYIPTETVVASAWLNVVNQYIFASSGPTSSRPTVGVPAGVPDGWRFIDLTLGPYGLPIFASHLSPTSWVNAAGVPV